MNMVRFYRIGAVVMFAVAGVFLWFSLGSAVWYDYAFTLAMAVISGIAGVTSWMSAKYEKDCRAWQEKCMRSQELYQELCDKYEALFGKNQELCDAYKELCESYEDLCGRYHVVCGTLQNKNRPEE